MRKPAHPPRQGPPDLLLPVVPPRSRADPRTRRTTRTAPGPGPRAAATGARCHRPAAPPRGSPRPRPRPTGAHGHPRLPVLRPTRQHRRPAGHRRGRPPHHHPAQARGHRPAARPAWSIRAGPRQARGPVTWPDARQRRRPRSARPAAAGSPRAHGTDRHRHPPREGRPAPADRPGSWTPPATTACCPARRRHPPRLPPPGSGRQPGRCGTGLRNAQAAGLPQPRRSDHRRSPARPARRGIACHGRSMHRRPTRPAGSAAITRRPVISARGPAYSPLGCVFKQLEKASTCGRIHQAPSGPPVTGRYLAAGLLDRGQLGRGPVVDARAPGSVPARRPPHASPGAWAVSRSLRAGPGPWAEVNPGPARAAPSGRDRQGPEYWFGHEAPIPASPGSEAESRSIRAAPQE